MFIIYGANGWIEEKIQNELKRLNVEIYLSEGSLDNIFLLDKEIYEIKPTNIINFEKGNSIHSLSLAIICKKYNIHFTNIKNITEYDDKNIDQLLLYFENVLNINIYNPISSDLNPDNFLMKMMKYEKMENLLNSFAILEEIIPLLCQMSINKETGPLCLSNEGTIEKTEIVKIFKEILNFDVDLNFTIQKKLKEPNTIKLLSKYKVSHISSLIKNTIQNFKANLEHLRKIQIENYTIVVGGEFELPTDEMVTEFLCIMKDSNADILSPVIHQNEKLVYYGGIVCKHKVLLIDEKFIPFHDCKNYKNSFNYVKSTMLFYPRYFIVKTELINTINILNVDVNQILPYSIKVTPFTHVKRKINIECKFSNMDKVDIFNFEIPCVKEFLNFNLCFGITPLKIQNRKFLDNNLKYVLIVEPDLLRPDKDCGSIYTLNLIKLLIENKIQVHFLPINFCYEEKYVQILQKMGVYVNYNSFNDVTAYLSVNCNVYENIFVCRFNVMNEIYDKIRNYCSQSKIIYVTVDLQSLRTSRFYELVKRQDFDANLMQDTLKLKELSYIKRCDYALVVSTFEQSYLRNEGINNFILFPICYEKEFVKQRLSEKTDGFYFIGSRHDPNIDAVNYFLKYIYHQILKIQSIPFYIFGSCVKGIVPDLLKPYGNLIKGTEYISDEDLKTFLNGVRLNIIPLRFGAGVKGKLLQSLNLGIPTITTDVGVEGTVFEDQKHLFILNLDDENYASKFVSIYNNIDLLDRISQHGKEAFDTNYSLEKGNDYMLQLLTKLEKKEIIVKQKICVIFNTFDKPEIIKSLKNYLQSIDGNTLFDFFLVNNGEKVLDSTFDEFNPLQGDNSTNEFSGIQKCINMLIDTHKISDYHAFIFCNDTIALHFPLSFMYTVSKAEIEIVCRNRYAMGCVDSFNKNFQLDNFTLKEWYRAFFIMLNANVFKEMNYKYLYYKVENVYENEDFKIHVDEHLKMELKKILSTERYKNRNDLNKKYTCIFNEYRLSYEIQKKLHD